MITSTVLLIPPRYNEALTLLPTDDARATVRDKFESPVIRNMKAEDAITQVMAIIQIGIKNLGHWNQADDNGILKHLGKGMISEILGAKDMVRGKSNSDFKNITIAEFTKAVQYGSTGSYKKAKELITTVNLENLIYWCECYLTDQTRQAAIKYHRLLLTEAPPKVEPTPEQRHIIMRRACNEAYEGFKKDGSLPEIYPQIYDYLKEVYGIKWNEREREGIKTEAVESYHAKLKARRFHGGIKEMPSKEEIQKGVKNEMKRIGLRIIFMAAEKEPFKN